MKREKNSEKNVKREKRKEKKFRNISDGITHFVYFMLFMTCIWLTRQIKC